MNCLDFDAISRMGRHDLSTLVSGLLSVAESADSSGEDLILATALALEISGRIKSAVEGVHAQKPTINKML
jgi:2-methylcitrate dehydratase PrpD